MDYFQTPRQNSGGNNSSSNQQQQQGQQYHPYNGISSQQEYQSNQQAQSNSYYGQQQQQQQLNSQSSQQSTGQYFSIQPASATSPLDHGAQHTSSYHHNSNNGQQQQQHNNGQNDYHHHHQSSNNQHSSSNRGGRGGEQQSHHTGIGSGSHSTLHHHHQQQNQQNQQNQQQSGRNSWGKNHQQNNRRGQLNSLMNQQGGQHHHNQQQQQQHHNQMNQQQQHHQHHQNQNQGSHGNNQQHHQNQQNQHHHQNQNQQHHQHHQQHNQHNQHHHNPQNSSAGGVGNNGGPLHSSGPQQQHQNQQHQQNSHVAVQAAAAAAAAAAPFMMHMQPMGDLPVRIVISSRFVGAVMGQGGLKIREITKESHAKVIVDSQKMGPKEAQETIINVLGTTENCSRAIVRILEVVQRENNKDEANIGSDVELKIRAHNQLVGRLIGKQGATIKKIMTETDATIIVSNDQPPRGESSGPYGQMDINSIERTICVRGPTIEIVSAAESKISQKLRKCFEMDNQHRMQVLQNNIQAGAAAGAPGGPTYGAGPAGAVGKTGGLPPFSGNTLKALRMWVPADMVGAIIGSKGKYIKQILKDTGAQVKFDAPEERVVKKTPTVPVAAVEEGEGSPKEEGSEKVEDEEEQRHGLLDEGVAAEESEESEVPAAAVPVVEKKEERMVTITGADVQILRAQIMVYAKIAEQLPQGFEELKLRTEVSVPSKIVGRIIGRKGQNVRELQRITGATVKIPEEEKAVENEDNLEEVYKEKGDDEATVVRIIGTVHATHNVQFRLSQLVLDHLKGGDKKKEYGGNSGDNNSPPPAAAK